MAYNQPIKVQPGLIRRQALEDVLKYPSDVQLVQKAREEYIDMLAIEKYFSEIDSNTHKYLCKRYERMSVSAYSVFGEELIAEHKNSKLIKHIMGVYKSKRLALCQTAMLEFSLLKEICRAYEKYTQYKKENFSSTHSGTGNPRVNAQELQTSTLYQTAHPSKSPRTTGVAGGAPVEIHGQIFYPETMYKQLEHRASEQFKDIDTLQTNIKDANLQINDLRNSAQKDTEMIKQLKQKAQDLSKLLVEERETNENVRTKNQKEMCEKEKDITELRKEKARLKGETEQLKQEEKHIKNKAKKEVDKTETTASEQSDTNIATSPNRFAQCPIVEGKWSSEKDTELRSLQEQNKSYEESMMTMLKAKRIKEDENSKLKTKVQQLEREFLKKAKEVDSLKIEKQALEERLNKQTKE